MFKGLVQKVSATMAGTVASIVLVNAVTAQPVLAVTFTSNLTVEGTNFLGNPVPLATSTYSYTKTDLRGRFKSFKGSNLSYPSDHDTDHRQINKCLGCLWQ